jgi:hypothetical protein
VPQNCTKQGLAEAPEAEPDTCKASNNIHCRSAGVAAIAEEAVQEFKKWQSPLPTSPSRPKSTRAAQSTATAGGENWAADRCYTSTQPTEQQESQQMESPAVRVPSLPPLLTQPLVLETSVDCHASIEEETPADANLSGGLCGGAMKCRFIVRQNPLHSINDSFLDCCDGDEGFGSRRDILKGGAGGQGSSETGTSDS